MTGGTIKPIRHRAVEIHETREGACAAISDELEIMMHGRVTLGLATGGTPRPLYAEWVRRHREQGLSFVHATTFNLDEYEGLGPEDPRSYRRFMDDRLFGKVDIDPRRTHLPPGCYLANEAERVAAGYEALIRDAGGIDWQLLGIGRSGHVGFNEPGSPETSRTRRVRLAEETREDAAAAFGGIDRVPTHAMTMGIRTILEARRIVLVAWGAEKAELVRRALTGPVGPEFPASFLQHHPNLRVVLAEIGEDEP